MAWLLTAWKAYRLWIGIGVVVALIGGLVLYVHGAEKAKADVRILKAQARGWDIAVTTLKGALEKNQTAIKDCEATNDSNTSEIGRVKADLDAAEANVNTINRNSDTDIERFHRDAQAMRGTDTTCRTLDDPLPDAFVAGVRRPAAADHH
jgi:hypothetical protein